MVRLSQSMDFEWPAEVVWSYLIAFEQVPLWEHGVLEVHQVTPGEPVVGTEITARRVYAGVETALTGSVVAYEPGRSATLELRGGPHLGSRATYSVEPADDAACVVTYTAEVELHGPLRLLGPILPLLGRQETRKNLRRLRRRIAAGIPPRSDEPTPD